MDQNLKLSEVIKQVGNEKGVEKTTLIETLEVALSTAAKRVFGQQREIEAYYNEEIDEIELFQILRVWDDMENPYRDITPEDAEEHGFEVSLGDELLVQIFYRDEDRDRAIQQDKTYGDLLDLESSKINFGRIAAQTAKQVILQRMREAEQDIIYNRYKDREGELITGKVRRFEKGNIIVSLDESGETNAILPSKEQTPRETFRMEDTIEAYVKKVQRSSREPQIVLSRTAPELVKKLFEKVVPEMNEGIVQILRVARQPGMRTKVAVYSSQTDVDAVGACVGIRGQRVQSVVNELRGEKIDIVPFHDDAARFVCSAISPAEVSRVFIEEKTTSMEIIVPNDQLSLAIGRGGQNVRLAAQLTGWNLDIISESRLNELKNEAKRLLMQKGDIAEEVIDTLFTLGYNKLDQIADVDPAEFGQIPGLGASNAEKIVTEAKRILAATRKEEATKENREQNISDIATYLGIPERQAKQIYNGGYHTLPILFLESDAKRMDARTALGTNLTASIIKNLEELALGQEVYTADELAEARAQFNSYFVENTLCTVTEAYSKILATKEEKIFPFDEDDDDFDDADLD